MYQTGLKRNEYLEGTIPDIRNVLVNYGHWLEKLGIENEGTLENYEIYLMELDKQKELEREDEHLELICWIEENKNYEFPFMIIKGEDYDVFQYSDNENEELIMTLVECDEFYSKFKEITGVDLMELDNFVSMTYINEARNDIEVIIEIDGNNQRYIIGI